MDDTVGDWPAQAAPAGDSHGIPLLELPDENIGPSRRRRRKANSLWLASVFLTIGLIAGHYSQVFAGIVLGIVGNLLTIVVEDIDLGELASRMQGFLRRGTAQGSAFARKPIWRTRQIAAYRVIEIVLYLTLTALGLYAGQHTRDGQIRIVPAPDPPTTTLTDNTDTVGAFTLTGPSEVTVGPDWSQESHERFQVIVEVTAGGPVTVTASGACRISSELGPLHQLDVTAVGLCRVTGQQMIAAPFSAGPTQQLTIPVVQRSA